MSVTLTTSGPDEIADTVLLLVDSNQELIAYNDDGGSDGYSRIAKPLDPGTYYVIVKAFDDDIINDYSLTVSFSNDLTPPVVSNVQADITEPTNQNVTVTAEFSDNVGVVSKMYMIGNSGYWIDYPSGGVVVTKNRTVSFMAVDAAGNQSEIVSYSVTNIETDPDIYGDNNSFDTAYDLGSDDAIQSAYGASIATIGEKDYYTFTLTKRTTVKLATNGVDDDDTYMYLYDIVDMTSQRFEYTGDGLSIRGDGNNIIWANKGDKFLFGDAAARPATTWSRAAAAMTVCTAAEMTSSRSATIGERMKSNSSRAVRSRSGSPAAAWTTGMCPR